MTNNAEEKDRVVLSWSSTRKTTTYAVDELLSQYLKNDENTSRDLGNAIFAKVKEEARIVGWKTKRSSEKKMSIAIYDILIGNDNFPADKVDDLTTTIIELAKKDL